MTKGSWLLYDVVFNVRYCVVCFSYLVMYYGDKVWSYFGSVCPVHIVVTQYIAHVRNWNQFSKKLLLLWNSEN